MKTYIDQIQVLPANHGIYSVKVKFHHEDTTDGYDIIHTRTSDMPLIDSFHDGSEDAAIRLIEICLNDNDVKFDTIIFY